MMKSYCTIIGIDVSKDRLDLAELSGQQISYDQIANDEASILTWIGSLDKAKSLCVLEPTGSYSAKLIYHLCLQGVALKVVNPRQSSHFIKAMGVINQDDKKAARALAIMADAIDLPLYQMPDAMMQQRKQILSSLSALKKQRRMLQNQLHALSYQPIVSNKVQQAFEQTLTTVEQQIQLLEQELDSLSDEEHQDLLTLITSVVGVGPKTAQALILATGGLDSFTHHRQLAKFVGIVPASRKSGSSVRFSGRITKHGPPDLRATLYMAARSARRFNLACKALYERLKAAGKCHKQAMVAVMNKLLRQIFAVVKNNTKFDNHFHLK